MRISKKIIYLFLFYLLFSACSPEKGTQLSVKEPDYDFLVATATVQKQATMREQRDMAFTDAKYTLKAQTSREVEAFLSAYLESIGLTNEKTLKRLCDYVNMDMDPLFEKVRQADILIVPDQAMSVTVTLDAVLFETTLKEAIKNNFQRDRSVWDRFQEQASQDMLNRSLDILLQRKSD